jgi:demethylmenaquinone methyltransferase/2-methoxy-6-polyprenyl-1,4-benzoquinol methylase
VIVSERNRFARGLFAPIAPTYDRFAPLLSLGQDPYWRRFLVSRVEASREATVLDVATGTGAVAIELARATGCAVVGVDQSPEMLAVARDRVERAGLGTRIRLVEASAERLPFGDAGFDAVTFTYLLRYVEDPAATIGELARVVRPGGRVACLEFFVPTRVLPRALWELYVRAGLPLLGRAAPNGWGRVGSFLGPSIRAFWRRYPLEALLELWRAAGIDRVQARTLSLGGGVVIWGERAG